MGLRNGQYFASCGIVRGHCFPKCQAERALRSTDSVAPRTIGGGRTDTVIRGLDCEAISCQN